MARRELAPATRHLSISYGFGRCHRTLTSEGKDLPLCIKGQKNSVEHLWREFFSDPSKWWDHRLEKANARYPDFKHKQTQEGLWLNGKLNPLWVEGELAAMAPGAVQCNIFSWNGRLSKFLQAGKYEKALDLFQQMQQEGISPDMFTFVRVLNACASLRALEKGRRIHTQIIESGYESDVNVGNSLVDMYAKCRSIDDAQRVFNMMPTRKVVAYNAIILGYVRCGQGQKALELSQQMQSEQVEPVRVTFVGLLNACASLRALEEGRLIHTQIKQSAWESDIYVGNSLIDMYSKCESIDDARLVFEKMPTPDVVSWNVMISGHGKCGQALKALELFRLMSRKRVQPNTVTFVGVLNACASVGALKEGRGVHKQIIETGCESDVFVGSSLIDMYAKCGSIDDAWRVFSKMPSRNVVCWNTIILGHVKCGQAQKGLEIYRQMQLEGVQPNPVTFVGLLNACASVGALEEGRNVHEKILSTGCNKAVNVANSLVDMYVKCGSIEDAWNVFNKMPLHDVVSWNAIILGYVKCGKAEKALELSGKMKLEGVEPDAVTLVGFLNACASLGALEKGRHIHAQVIQSSFEFDEVVGNSLIDMYAKCGSIEDAWRVFSKMVKHDVVSWNAMILGFVRCGQSQNAFELSKQMQQDRVEPDSFTFVGLLNACAGLGALEKGRHIHEQIIQSGLECDVFVGNSLVDMYAKCGSIEDAWRVFKEMPARNGVSWSSMIQGYVKCGQGQKALDLSHQMHEEGVHPDPVALVGLLKACASVTALEEGRCVHEQIIQSGYESHGFVGNSLVDMYAKCGSIEDARTVFDKMPSHDVVGWSALIQGYVKCGQGDKALKLITQMEQEGVDPDPVTFVGFLNACASVAALDEGRRVHEQIVHRGLDSDIFVGNSLVDMYGKCGSIEDAQRVFMDMPIRDKVSWTALLGGYAIHGHAKEAVGHFEQMCQEGVELDKVTMISLLSACSHGGLVDEGLQYFESMTSVYGISPTLEHYVCIADLLGRAGRLHEAEDLIMTIPCELDVVLWMSLLGACRVHGNVEMGECIGKRVLELDPGNSAAHILLSNIYAAAGNWDGRASIQHQRLERAVKKQPVHLD